MDAYFFDTSALIKRYIEEPGRLTVRSIINTPPIPDLHIVGITRVEMASALSRLALAPHADVTLMREALASFESDFPGDFSVIAITPELLDDAARFAQRHALRAYDAIQLAGCIELNQFRLHDSLPLAPLVSSDAALNDAALAEGLPVINPEIADASGSVREPQ